MLLFAVIRDCCCCLRLLVTLTCCGLPFVGMCCYLLVVVRICLPLFFRFWSVAVCCFLLVVICSLGMILFCLDFFYGCMLFVLCSL